MYVFLTKLGLLSSEYHLINYQILQTNSLEQTEGHFRSFAVNSD